MATPFLSGCAALWLEASRKPTWSHEHPAAPKAEHRYYALAAAFINTAAPVLLSAEGNKPQSVFQMGAGELGWGRHTL